MGEMADMLIETFLDREFSGYDQDDYNDDPFSYGHNVDVVLKKVTEKAILVMWPDLHDKWLPKSQIRFNEYAVLNRKLNIRISDWLFVRLR